MSDQNGARVPGAQVTLRRGASIDASTTTDDEGRFSLDASMNPRARTSRTSALVLEVCAHNFMTFTRTLSAQDEITSQLLVTLAPASVAAELTVTATRAETRLGDTAASVAVLTPEQLSTTAAGTLDDALRQVAGFSLFRRSSSRNANPTTQGVSLRGVGASGASRALVVEDGVPLNDPFGGWVYWERVPRVELERVEVLRGGASELYGSDALGGVVNIITRRAVSHVASLELSYGNQQTPDASLFVGATRGRWGFDLGAEVFHTGGYVLVDKDERGRIDTPAGTRDATLDLTLERRFGAGAHAFMRGMVFGESRTNGTPLQTNRTHLRQLSAGGEWVSGRFGSFTLGTYDGTEVFDQNFSSIAADRNSEQLTRLQRSPSQFVGFNAEWSRTLGARQTLVAGFDAREVHGASDELAFAQGRPTSFADAGGRERTGGLYFEEIVRFGSRLILTGGVRADHWNDYAAFGVTRPVRASSVESVSVFPDRSESAFSPRASLLFRKSERLSFFASGYRAFRQPTLNELYRSFRVGNILTLANENLRAEHLTGGEAGFKVTRLGKKLDARTTLFWTEITGPVANVTLSLTPALITRQRQNLGRTRSRGLEVEADAQLTSRLYVSGGYIFSDAVVTRFPANTALEGLRVPQVARNQLTFQTRYVNPKSLTVGVQGRFSGMQFDDDQNLFPLNRAFTLDAFASRQLTRDVGLFLAAENLLDQRYQIARTPVVTLGSPLLVRVGLRLNLGTR
ncbi:MAG TPA: TonB-dependent receptor [Pyrinomonadaceae bacterium]|nr:TonB-dependent receptor [Pyrinomonadaceae bacterium]